MFEVSDAILKGCELSPVQNHGTYCDFSCNDDLVVDARSITTCAFGAAALAVVGLPQTDENALEWLGKVEMAAYEMQRRLGRKDITCPEPGCTYEYKLPLSGSGAETLNDTLAGIVAFHLNDEHCWTRERIAAWLRSLGH